MFNRLPAGIAIPSGADRPQGIGLELHRGERRHRRQGVRIDDRQHRVGQFGELVVQLVADAAGEEGKRLDEALDVRVGGAVRLQLQARRRRRVLASELLRELADEVEFGLVVGVEFLAHDAPHRRLDLCGTGYPPPV